MNSYKQTSRRSAAQMIVASTALAVVLLCMAWVQGGSAQATVGKDGSDVASPTSTVTAQVCHPLWNVVESPNIGGSDNYLTAVDALTENDAWAVGYYTGTGRYETLTMHWDGTHWSVVPSPNEYSFNMLRGVTAIASNDVWAVGTAGRSATASVNLLTMHWDGTQWSVVANPNYGGNYANGLYAAKGFAANDMWTTGFTRSSTWLDLKMHWNGTAWAYNYSPYISYGFLYGIDGLISSDVWAVGYQSTSGTNPLIEHWIGGTWSVVSNTIQTGTLYGVSMVASNDVWAVGADGNDFQPQHSISGHWDGTTWSNVQTPNVGKVGGVKALATDDVWAVGDGAYLHWDGAAWNVITNQSGGKLAGIDALAANNMWAVGTQNVGGVKRTVIEHYTPTCATETPTLSPTPTLTPTATPCVHAWTEIPSQNVGTGDNVLKSVDVIAADDVWAVGYYTGTNSSGTLTQHWDGIQWSIVPSPNEDQFNVLRGVSAVASNDVWAVGSYAPDFTASTHLLTIHWDGSQWNVVPNPDPGGNYANWLNGVKAFDANNVWVVGFYRNYVPLELVMRWDGTQWSVQGSPSNGAITPFAVDGVGPTDVWMSGITSAAPGWDNYEHWNANGGSVVRGGISGINQVNDLVAIATDDVWGVGYYDSDGTRISMMQRWHNGYWSTYTVQPSISVGELFGATALGVDDVWAAGERGFMRRIGESWNPVTNPISGTLYAIDSVSPDDIWAVGMKDVDGVKQSLIERYLSECTPTTVTPTPVVPTPTVTRTGTSTPSRTGTVPTATNTAVQSSPTATTPGTIIPTRTGTVPTATNTAVQSSPTSTSTSLVSVSPTSTESTATPQATSTVCAIEFADVPVGSTFYSYVKCLACRGIVQGYGDGTYRPNSEVTRGQAAKIVANSAGWNNAIPEQQQTFVDVAPGSTFWVYAERSALHGAITGYACGGVGEPCPGMYFRPSRNVTRGQIAKIVSNAAGYSDEIPAQQQTFSDVLPGSTFWLYVERVAVNGVVNGYDDGTFRVENAVTRGQIAKVSAIAFLPECVGVRY